MPHLSPSTLTHIEQKAILRATARNPRDHLIYSLALGTGLRLAEIVSLDVGDVYTDDRTPRTRLKLRPAPAPQYDHTFGCRAGEMRPESLTPGIVWFGMVWAGVCVAPTVPVTD